MFTLETKNEFHEEQAATDGCSRSDTATHVWFYLTPVSLTGMMGNPHVSFHPHEPSFRLVPMAAGLFHRASQWHMCRNTCGALWCSRSRCGPRRIPQQSLLLVLLPLISAPVFQDGSSGLAAREKQRPQALRGGRW